MPDYSISATGIPEVVGTALAARYNYQPLIGEDEFGNALPNPELPEVFLARKIKEKLIAEAKETIREQKRAQANIDTEALFANIDFTLTITAVG